MTDINVRSDSVEVEQIMRQIRARIREKRGADYTEAELQQLASVKLQQFLDPRGLRSDLVEQFRRHRPPSPPLPNYAFEDTTLFETHRGPLRTIRRLLQPLLKLFFNPNKISDALHVQAQINDTVAARLAEREGLDPLLFEVIHNLVIETTRLGIEVQNLKMRVESLSSRLDFDERRARALETVVEYTPGARRGPAQSGQGGAPASAGAPATGGQGDDGAVEGGGPRRRRRRRRRRPGQTAAEAGGSPDADRAGGGPSSGATEAGGDDEGGAGDQGDETRSDRGSDREPEREPGGSDPGASDQ
jgi:hypothetical protein